MCALGRLTRLSPISGGFEFPTNFRDEAKSRGIWYAPPSQSWDKVMTTLTAYIELDEETGLYVGIVPGIPGAHTQAASLDELRANLQEVLELCLEEQTDLRERLPKFVGVQQIEVA
jgi:predicted RNase H-like HicB family nuclease